MVHKAKLRSGDNVWMTLKDFRKLRHGSIGRRLIDSILVLVVKAGACTIITLFNGVKGGIVGKCCSVRGIIQGRIEVQAPTLCFMELEQRNTEAKKIDRLVNKRTFALARGSKWEPYSSMCEYFVPGNEIT